MMQPNGWHGSAYVHPETQAIEDEFVIHPITIHTGGNANGNLDR